MRGYKIYKNKQGIYAAEILNPDTGERVCYRSTMTKNRDEALLTVNEWLKSGIPERKRGRAPIYKKSVMQSVDAVINLDGVLKIIKKADIDAAGAKQIVELLKNRGLLTIPILDVQNNDIDFIEYLKNFFDYDKSPYVKEKKAHGQNIGKRYCIEQTVKIENFWEAYFNGRKLASITRKDLKGFSLFIADKGYSSYYLNTILNAGTVPLNYAFYEGLIPINPSAGLKKFANIGQRRGCLTPQEATQVFSCYWHDKNAYIANMLAMTTGARMGEILAISKNDIDAEKPILHIRHSWSNRGGDGLKAPKNGEIRKVPLLPDVKKMLLELLAENPHKTDNPFLFYGLEPDKPRADGKFMGNALRQIFTQCGIDYKARKICFHSWRHFYAARLADKMTAEQVQRITGHKTKAVFDIYADHVIDENIEAVGIEAEQIFNRILQFKKGA